MGSKFQRSELLHYRTIALQNYCTTELLHYRTIALQNYCTTELLHYRTIALQNYCTTELLHYRTIALQNYCTTELLHYRTIALQTYCTTELQKKHQGISQAHTSLFAIDMKVFSQQKRYHSEQLYSRQVRCKLSEGTTI